MLGRLTAIVLLFVALAASGTAEAGGFFHHRHAPVAVGRIDYAPYSYYAAPSIHGPAYYSPAYRPPARVIAPTFHRSYYAPVNYGYSRPYGLGTYGYSYGFSRFGYGGLHYTRYGIYGGSYGFAPLTVGYPYATGYLSTVRPVQPYLHSYSRLQVGAVPAYTPCVYGSYGYRSF